MLYLQQKRHASRVTRHASRCYEFNKVLHDFMSKCYIVSHQIVTLFDRENMGGRLQHWPRSSIATVTLATSVAWRRREWWWWWWWLWWWWWWWWCSWRLWYDVVDAVIVWNRKTIPPEGGSCCIFRRRSVVRIEFPAYELYLHSVSHVTRHTSHVTRHTSHFTSASLPACPCESTPLASKRVPVCACVCALNRMKLLGVFCCNVRG